MSINDQHFPKMVLLDSRYVCDSISNYFDIGENMKTKTKDNRRINVVYFGKAGETNDTDGKSLEWEMEHGNTKLIYIPFPSADREIEDFLLILEEVPFTTEVPVKEKKKN